MNNRTILMALLIMAVGPSHAWAQEPVKKAGETGAMPGMDHSDVHGRTSAAGDRMSEAAKMGHDSAPMSKEAAGSGMHMDHGSMQGGEPPPDARDPHAYSGGYTLDPARPLRLADEHNFYSLLFDRLESASSRDNTVTAYDLHAWYGRTYDRAVFKSEGEVDGGKLRNARTELLWGHAIATYWDTQLGVRYDSGTKPERKWLAFGVQGLAPYWFEVDATAYVGEEGRTALRLAGEYELLLTQKLILQPRVEANFYGKSDDARARGAGLSSLDAGLRLRYEIWREFAPYVGIEWTGKYGGTADFARAAGERTRKAQLVAGLRFWF